MSGIVEDGRAIRPFGTLPTIDGYDVIALDTGRPLDHRETLQEANGVAFHLNEAAKNGPKALARALKAS
jgi:hypothetical protein